MKKLATIVICLGVLLIYFAPVLAQEVGDYRTRDSGDWGAAQIWERFNGTAWVAVATPPTGSETITVLEGDSVFVNVEVSVTGRLVNQGIVSENGTLTIEDGGIYQHDLDEGSIPFADWAEGSTLLMTGTAATAPANRNQPYHHVVFDTPGLASNLNMQFEDVTIGGDITVLNTGFTRWYLTSALANDTSMVTIMGDVIVEGGQFSVQGTSNALTTFIVHHYGNIQVTGGNFSISRGSQAGGTTTWNLHEGDFSLSNATSQNSTATPGGARFVFRNDGTQTLTIGEGAELMNLPIEVASGTTLEMGESRLSGGGIFVLNENATLGTALAGGVAEIFANVVVEPTLEDDSGFAFNGTVAQVTSSRMPTVVSDLIIDNPEGVTLSQETTINGVLRLRQGVFDNTIPFELGPEGSISLEGGSLLHPVSSEADSGIPQAFFVDQNFPNPFNPSTVIRFGLPSDSHVTVKVFNMLGREVRTLVDGHRSAGVHELAFEAGGLSSGVYLYRVEAKDVAVTKRMLLIK